MKKNKEFFKKKKCFETKFCQKHSDFVLCFFGKLQQKRQAHDTIFFRTSIWNFDKKQKWNLNFEKNLIWNFFRTLNLFCKSLL